MRFDIHLDPLLPWPVVLILAIAAGGVLARALVARRAGTPYRLAVLAILVCSILNPSLDRERREYHNDIVVLLDDRSASQEIGRRMETTDQALAALKASLGRMAEFEIAAATFRNRGGSGAEGTRLFSALNDALAELDRDRVAGAVLISDGQNHEGTAGQEYPFPVHALISGSRDEFDRRVRLDRTPAFAVVGEPVGLSVVIEDDGSLQGGDEPTIAVSVNGGPATTHPAGRRRDVVVNGLGRGRNLVVVSTPSIPGETTAVNNVASVAIHGVRDRLRVLLVSGFPHPGQRTWRNILKSDESIELVHFTILRTSMDRQAAGPDEIALIPFPVHELFLQQIQSFDLIIFDRYLLLGLLPAVYFKYISDYVGEGGALLVAAGPEFAGASSVYHTALADILPGRPTGEVVERGFPPSLTATGFRHPVTAELPGAGDPAGDGGPEWGRWFRQVRIVQEGGHAVMDGAPGGGPLLLLDRIDDGRVALLGSDQAWLWHRGVEGGGPQLELLRRLVHWLMQEPELEEEALVVSVEGARLMVERRALDDDIPQISAIGPEGKQLVLAGSLRSPGRFAAEAAVVAPGLYQVSDGRQVKIVAAGPEHRLEHQSTVATDAYLYDPVARSGGGMFWIEDGVPEARSATRGRAAFGTDWLGLVERKSYRVTAIETMPLLPGLLVTMLTLLGAALAWSREGKIVRSW